MYFRYPSDDELHLIVKDQLIPVYNRFKKHLGNIYVDQIVDALIEIYSQVRQGYRFIKIKILYNYSKL